MTEALDQALESTLAALADSYDQLVFLQQAVDRALKATGMPDLLNLITDAQNLMGAGGFALSLAGRWVGAVPSWLDAQPRPDTHAFELPVRHLPGPASFLGVPFTGGWVAFWDKHSPFSAGDARLAQTLSDLIVSTLEAIDAREQRFRQEMEEHDRALASRIWRHLVPATLPEPFGYRLSTRSEPASQVGGDFHIALGPWIMVGDVSGKGIAAALFTGMFVSSLRLAIQHEDVGAAVAQALHTQLEDAGMLATLAVIYLEGNGAFRYLSMGHPPILIRRADGTVDSLRATAPPLGTFQLERYPMLPGRIEPGDLMCLYSDGLSEAQRTGRNGELELFEYERIAQVLTRALTPAHGLELLQEAMTGWTVDDDLTVVLLQYAPEGKVNRVRNNTLKLRLPADTAELAALGVFVRDGCQRLPEPGLPEVALTELAVNAIVHGHASHLQLTLHDQDDGILITLEDDGAPFDPTLAPEQAAGELREGGYGLLIVRRSASRITYTRRGAWNCTELLYANGGPS